MNAILKINTNINPQHNLVTFECLEPQQVFKVHNDQDDDVYFKVRTIGRQNAISLEYGNMVSFSKSVQVLPATSAKLEVEFPE